MYATRNALALLMLAPLTAILACSPSDQGDEGMEAGEAAEATEEPTQQMEMETPTTVFDVTLAPANESSVTGSASATARDGTVEVEVRVDGVSATGELPTHIHQGTCAAGGTVLAPLTSIPIAEGTGSSTTTLSADQLDTSESTFVQVHDPEGRPIACADLPGGEGM